jgi:hypothetical protein
MQLSRKSKRQAGKDVDEEVVTKRPARATAPNHQSLAGFEKKLEATIQAKPVGKRKPRRQSKGPARLDTPCLIAEPQDQTLFVSNGRVLRLSLSTNTVTARTKLKLRDTTKYIEEY